MLILKHGDDDIIRIRLVYESLSVSPTEENTQCFFPDHFEVTRQMVLSWISHSPNAFVVGLNNYVSMSLSLA
jgi:hypothetical protein